MHIFLTSMLCIFSLPYNVVSAKSQFLSSLIWFAYGLLGASFQLSLLSDNPHFQYQISEENNLLRQPVSDGTEIFKPGQSIGLLICKLAPLESGDDNLSVVFQPHNRPPLLCSVSPLGLEVCK